MPKIRYLFRLIMVLVCLGFCTSCQQKFDAQKWAVSVDGTYPHRKDMLDDLLENYPLKDKTVQETLELLGLPDNYCDHNPYEMTYRVVEDYGLNIDPVYTSYLVFYLDQSDTLINDSTRITKVEVREFDR